MSQGFRFRYDEMREGDPTKASAGSKASGNHTFYEAPSHARSLCLVWPHGKRIFLSYAYLVSGELSLDGEKNVITLSFSSHSVILKGYGLESLFMALLDHLPKMVVAIDPRYASTENVQEGLVTDIAVEKKEV